MSKPERGSLTTLLAKKPLGQGAPSAVPMEEAESVLIQPIVPQPVPSPLQTYGRTDVPIAVQPEKSAPAPADGAGKPEKPAGQPAVRTDVPTDGIPTKLLNRSGRRTVRVPWTFKLPFELREELEAVAKHNNLNMTEIAVEAIERHLKHFPHPPNGPQR
jgi:hypothetical protein